MSNNSSDRVQEIVEQLMEGQSAESLKPMTDKCTEAFLSDEIDKLPSAQRASVLAVMTGRYFAGYLASALDAINESCNGDVDLSARVMTRMILSLEKQLNYMSRKVHVPLDVQLNAPIDFVDNNPERQEKTETAC